MLINYTYIRVVPEVKLFLLAHTVSVYDQIQLQLLAVLYPSSARSLH